MSHQRTTIRSALKQMLIGASPTYNTAAQDRVYTNRINNKKTLPAIVINDGSEDAEPLDIQSRRFIRTFSVKIELTVASESVDYDIKLDDLAKQVEDLLSADRTISGTATSCTYVSTESSYESAQLAIGQAVLTFNIKYIA